MEPIQTIMSSKMTVKRKRLNSPIIALLATAIIAAATNVHADDTLYVSVGENRDVGVGFGYLDAGGHDLTLALQAPTADSGTIGWQIRTSEVIDGSGMLLWLPQSNSTPDTSHDYVAAGVIANDDHAVHIHGELILGPGPGSGVPEFDTYVAFLDVDVDSDGPSGSETEDQNEYGSGGGMEMPVTDNVDPLPATFPETNTNWSALQVKLVSDKPGTLSFSTTGSGLGIYRVSGSDQVLVIGDIAVPPGGLNETFRIHTGTQFSGTEDISIAFTPTNGIGTTEDIVTIYPAASALVDIDVDTNNDGVLDGADDADEDGQGVFIQRTEFAEALLHIVNTQGIDLTGHDVVIDVPVNPATIDIWDDPNGSTPVSLSPYAYDADVSGSIPFPTDIFAEGITEGTAQIEVRLIDPSGAEVDSDTVAVTVVSITLRQGTTNITDGSQDVLIGSQISLQAIVAAAGTVVTTHQWNVPGTRIADYEVDSDPKQEWGRVTPLTVLNTANVKYYWVDTGNNRQVTYTATINGKTFSASSSFNVKGPHAKNAPQTPVTISSTTSTIEIRQTGGDTVVQFGNPSGPEGIRLKRNPPLIERYGGSFQWVQLLSVENRYRTSATGRYARWIASGLDSVFPYLGDFNTVGDSPRAGLVVGSDLVDVEERFEMYFMYKPATPNAIWVPLRKTEWYWKAVVESSDGGNTWQINSKSNSVNPADSATTAHPEWEVNVIYVPHEWDD
jgi:hypothetical protein